MSQQIANDVYGVLRGLRKVTAESFKVKEKYVQKIWANSSVKALAEDARSNMSKTILDPAYGGQGIVNIEKLTAEALQRTNMVVEGVKALTSFVQTQNNASDGLQFEADLPPEFTLPNDQKTGDESQVQITASLKIESVPLTKPVENIIKIEPEVPSTSAGPPPISQDSVPRPVGTFQKPLGARESIPKLGPTAKARKVPSSRIGRMVSFGSLFAGLGVGTVAEVTRRSLGVNESLTDNPFLTSANVERIVSTMCKVRGAALKIGQLLSIQDSEIIPPALQAAFERVRQSADFMPTSQVEGVLKRELGDEWRSRFVEFDMKPFAAASIGQVHWGKLPDGTEVAVKIQYPGVAAGINSDIENLVSVLNIWNVFPPGMFIDKLVEVAKKELSWEVDYLREAECTKQFRALLEADPDYYVPRVIDELCTSQVFTSELIEGFSVDKAAELDLETRNRICSLIMHLCLKELFVFRVMQTDPNWSNFFYNQKTRQLVLLDFGATRSYSKEFMDQYLEVIMAAADRNRERVLKLSQEMGFLTGYESKAMEEAHVDTVMILGEVFSESANEFDFGGQNTVKRVTKYVPTMLNQRLCPPPEEIYSIHRKISGVFLLCSKLKVKIACRPMLMDIYKNYRFGPV
ncbi:ABC1 family [Nesidiocoris tenuis]|uniref:ABC1 family n=1 Tax=Nesidiocoris tenuis TaxID=355587 RepID=A0ABN7BAY3_9HEMI|nr:ABC1 family [Nesidiocoris tenuis]